MTSRASAEAGGLYIHVPFCSAICPYCDFAVRVGDRSKGKIFIEDLLREIVLEGPRLKAYFPTGFDTVYLGGGTPSILSPEDLRQLLENLRQTLPLTTDFRLSLEANPEDVHPKNLEAWQGLGVDMLSLGVQAFDDASLKFLGRRHTPEEAQRSVEMALAASFRSVSVDLIYCLPQQQPSIWKQTLETAISLAPQHLSCYELEIHRQTPFGKKLDAGNLQALGEEPRAQLFRRTHQWLAEQGYEGYEVSNFAREPSFHSRHNTKYWHHVPYLGLGPSAHSFAGQQRWWNERHLPSWQKKVRAGISAKAGHELLTKEDLALETVMLGMRTRQGIDLEDFHLRFGFDLISANETQVEELVKQDLLILDGANLRPTLEGMAVADTMATSLEVDANLL